MHLFLIRHGESWVNKRDAHHEHPLDAGLTSLGQKQASALADWFPGTVPHVDALYTSSMKRALETTQFLTSVYNCEAITDERIREIGNNRLDHTPRASPPIHSTLSLPKPRHPYRY